MHPFRDKLPVRRTIPTRNPSKNWTLHKPDLKIDFNGHCAYCDSYDGFRHTYFEVDHFVPKDFLKRIAGKIGFTQYSNLVYACKFCNNNKLDNWPSKSEKIYNDGKIGFVDPCDAVYDTHFYRMNDGGIMWNTELGKWMFTEAFKFDERYDSIKLLWNLNRIRKALEQLKLELNKYQKSSSRYILILEKMKEYSFDYAFFHTELIEYYGTV